MRAELYMLYFVINLSEFKLNEHKPV